MTGEAPTFRRVGAVETVRKQDRLERFQNNVLQGTEVVFSPFLAVLQQEKDQGKQA